MNYKMKVTVMMKNTFQVKRRRKSLKVKQRTKSLKVKLRSKSLKVIQTMSKCMGTKYVQGRETMRK